MTNGRPENPDEFTRWSSSETCGAFTASTRIWYETSQNNVYVQLQDHHFLAQLSQTILTCGEEYRKSTGARLFAFDRNPTINWNKKPYDSFVEKLFRFNCIENPNFPEPQESGWLSLERSFEDVDDIIRTTVIVSYADGPQFLAERLEELAQHAGLQLRVKEHAQEKGYYAYHLYPRISVPIATTSGSMDYVERLVPIEVQITTVLQSALREITHRLYERERLAGILEENWKNKFESGRFRAAYMAHSLRFIEAMIVDLRNTFRTGEEQR